MKTPTIKDIRTAAAARKTQRARRKRLVVWLGLLLVTGVVLVGVVLPRVVQSQVKTRLEAAFARPVEVGSIETDLLSLGVTIGDVEVLNPGGELLVKWARLHVNLQGMALLRGRAGFDAIELDGFEGNVVIDAAGNLNFADLIPERGEVAEDPADQGMGWAIGRFEVRDAKLDFADASRSTPFKTSFGPMSFSLQDFHTNGDPKAPYNFEAVTEAGEKIEWGGTLSLSPLKSQGQVTLTDFQIQKYAPYYEDALKFTVGGGLLSATSDYEWATESEGSQFALKGGTVKLADVVLMHELGGEPSIELNQLQIQGVEYDSVSSALDLEQVEWMGGNLVLVRNETGLDLARWFEVEADEAEGSDLAIKVGRLAIEEVAGNWTDRTLPQTEEWAIAAVKLDVTDIDLADLAAAVSLAVDLDFAGGGHVSVSGEMGLSPFRPTLAMEAQEVALSRLSPYFESGLGARLTQGALSMDGSLGMVGDGMVFRGNAGASGVRLTTLGVEEVAGWEDLKVGGLSFTSSPATWAIESVRWIRPEGRLHVRRDGSLNWTNAAATPSEIKGINLPEESEESKADETVVRVDRVELVEAQVEFSDESLPRKAEMTLTGLSGTLEGLSSLQVGKGEASLEGLIDGRAAVAISGDFNPLGTPAYTNLKMKFERMDLRSLGGYVNKYAGYQLARGRLSLDVDFKLEERIIQSSTVATLDDLELGEKFKSPDATKLPVKLAIALLKDSSGQIVIDLPVEGALDDPNFRYGRVIGRVLTNLLTKAATAPFALLGLSGGDSDEGLDTVGFAVGLAEIDEGEAKKLSKISEALSNRPELHLEIISGYNSESDRLALAPVLLERDLRLVMELPVDSIEPWEGNQRMTALVQRYIEVFGRPPIDPNSPVLPPTTQPVDPAEVPVTVEAAGGENDQTFLGWLKTVLSGNSANPPSQTEEVVTPIPDAVSEIQPELQALPPEVIAADLLARIEVSDVDLSSLAEARAQAVHGFMLERGIAESRLVVEPSQNDAAQVKLSLR